MEVVKVSYSILAETIEKFNIVTLISKIGIIL